MQKPASGQVFIPQAFFTGKDGIPTFDKILNNLHTDHLNWTEKSLISHLAFRAGKDGKCYPSEERMAQDLGLSIRTVQRTIAALERDGFLFVERFNPIARRLYHRTNRYHLIFLPIYTYAMDGPVGESDLPEPLRTNPHRTERVFIGKSTMGKNRHRYVHLARPGGRIMGAVQAAEADPSPEVVPATQGAVQAAEADPSPEVVPATQGAVQAAEADPSPEVVPASHGAVQPDKDYVSPGVSSGVSPQMSAGYYREIDNLQINNNSAHAEAFIKSEKNKLQAAKEHLNEKLPKNHRFTPTKTEQFAAVKINGDQNGDDKWSYRAVCGALNHIAKTAASHPEFDLWASGCWYLKTYGEKDDGRFSEDLHEAKKRDEAQLFPKKPRRSVGFSPLGGLDLLAAFR